MAHDVRTQHALGRIVRPVGVGHHRILGCGRAAARYVPGGIGDLRHLPSRASTWKDRACVDECPVDCIYEGKRMLYIHPDECVDCGACEPVCPVETIFYEDDTPEQWKDYYKANVEFFDDLGSPAARPRWVRSTRTTR